MERKICQLIIFAAFMQMTAFAQTDRAIYQAYVNGDMQSWKSRMDFLEKQSDKSNAEMLDLVNYQHGYIAWCIDQGRKEEAKKYIKKSEDHLAHLEKKKYRMPQVYAYKAAYIGFEIAIARHKAPFIGPESREHAKQSVRLDPKNVLGYVQLGNIEYYTPPIAGGSKTIAMQHYLNALRIMEQDENMISGNWNYLNLLATIINAYIETEQYQKALHYCEKTLSFEPDFDWVKNTLCPIVKNKGKYE
ncbi:MAG: hypothetical protein ACLFM1_07915 [Bacteroidales bacterium]